ncbi:MAG: hypothetical protein Q8R92_11205, partial [Deltaproteobacteria bacterium]|nr:hypothetical protein [Deltaproteobacteria bacterium]
LLVVFGGFGFAMIATDLRKPPGERGWMPWSLVGLVCAVFIGVIPIISGAPFLRYLFPIWPLFAIILAQAVHVLLRPTWLAWSAVAVLLATNALAVWPLRIVDDHIDFSLLAARGRSEAELRQNRFPAFLRGFDYQSAFFMPGWSPEVRPSLDVRAPLADYLTEITVGYRGPVDAIAEYLNAHKRPGDRFATVYEEAAVAFHTGLRPQDNGEGQPPPRWLVVRPTHGPKNDALNFWLQRATYRRIALDAHDTPYQNREELDLHRFRSPVAGPLIELGELVPAGER